VIDVSYEGPAATLTLNRPEARNALSIEMCDAIVESLAAIDRSDARAVVIAGAGKVFCAGADLAAVTDSSLGFLPAFERMLEAVARFRLPTIAAIHGAALGGGLQLGTVCDFRIAASDATLGIPAARLGIVVNFENVQRLVLLAGVGVTKQVLMAGQRFSGEEAEKAGLVTASVPAGELKTEVEDLARELAALAPLSVQGMKRSIQIAVDHLSAPSNAEIERLVLAAYQSDDLQEGINAMAEKRDPDFEGR
jgi:enoyl-CoA hydratase/carnithine racemase